MGAPTDTPNYEASLPTPGASQCLSLKKYTRGFPDIIQGLPTIFKTRATYQLPYIDLGEMGGSTDTPEASTDTPGASIDTPGASTDTPEASIDTPGASIDTPEASTDTPGASIDTPGASTDTP